MSGWLALDLSKRSTGWAFWNGQPDQTARFGSWALGSKILFLGPDGQGGRGGMVSRIAESRLHEYLGIEHLGMVSNGVEDTQSDAVKDWAGARENYSFSESSGVTNLRVDMQTAPSYEAMFNDTWPKALQKLKALSESSPL